MLPGLIVLPAACRDCGVIESNDEDLRNMASGNTISEGIEE